MGENFVADARGLPNTMVFDLASSYDGQLMFAATEAGPYVYILDSMRWYDLKTETTPVQTYWSVEWVDADSVARFGTYGRGIWDLQIGALPVVDTTTDTLLVATLEPVHEFTVFPNPARESFTISSSRTVDQLQVYAADGRRVPLNADRLRTAHQTNGASGWQLQIDCSSWTPGTYYISAGNGGAYSAHTLLVE
jgi:hypothetical protein